MSWNSPEHQYYNGSCTHPKAVQTISYHTGRINYTYARDIRHYFRSCGTSARYYLDVNDIEPPKTTHIVSCTDCVHQKLNTSLDQDEYALCSQPLVTKYDMVSGESVYPEMRNQAKPNDNKSCGTHGSLFEENTQQDQTSKETERHKLIQWFLLILLVVLLLL